MSDGLRIAVRIEQIEADAWAEVHLALPLDVRSRMGIEVRRYGTAVSLMTSGADFPNGNRTLALGFDRELTHDAVIGISTAYAAAGIPRWLLQWSPEARPPSAGAFFTACGGRAVTPTVKLWRPTAGDAPAVQPNALRVVEIGAEDAGLFEALVAEPLGFPPELAPTTRSTVGHACWHYYLAYDDGRPIAGAAMFVQADGAWFGLSATAASDRGRGAQTALLARRFQDAAALGCAWVSADTAPATPEKPNPSYRNMRRAGLDVLYHRPNYLFRRIDS